MRQVNLDSFQLEVLRDVLNDAVEKANQDTKWEEDNKKLYLDTYEKLLELFKEIRPDQCVKCQKIFFDTKELLLLDYDNTDLRICKECDDKIE